LPIAIAFVVVSIALSVGGDILDEIRSDQTASSYADLIV
jgi:hypothetical protein